MTDIKTVGVIGAGTMGNGIAQVFAHRGYDVHLVDAVAPALDRARGTIEKSLGKFVEKGKLSAEDRDAGLSRPAVRDQPRKRDPDVDRVRGEVRGRLRGDRREGEGIDILPTESPLPTR